MKVRLGFVSNSSSSSFICAVCGNILSGMDASLEDFEMFECQNGHTVCQSHLSEKDQGKLDELREDDDFDLGSIDPELCPVCKLEVLPDDLLLQYILKDFGTTKETVLFNIRNSFLSYKEFFNYIKK